jgi:hypothetical protein
VKRMRLDPVMLEVMPTEVQLQALDAQDTWIDPLLATLDDSTAVRVAAAMELAYRAGIVQGGAAALELAPTSRVDQSHVFPSFGELLDVDAPRPAEPTPLQTSAMVSLELLARKPRARRVDLDVNLVRELCEAALRQTPTT